MPLEPIMPEIIEDLAARAAESARLEFGLDAAKASAYGKQVANAVWEAWGGQQVYIPKPLSKRDVELYARFRGGEAKEKLIREHRLTTQRFYQIVAAMQERVLRERQTVLFNE